MINKDVIFTRPLPGEPGAGRTSARKPRKPYEIRYIFHPKPYGLYAWEKTVQVITKRYASLAEARDAYLRYTGHCSGDTCDVLLYDRETDADMSHQLPKPDMS